MFKHISQEAGFTIMEVLCAMVVLTIGLMGVAAMQAKAIQGNSFAASFNEGSMQAEAWMEWFEGYANWPYQANRQYNGQQLVENFCTIAEMDTASDDAVATVIQVPADMAGLLDYLSDQGFYAPRLETDKGSSSRNALTADQIPGPPGRGYTMEWRVTANMPLQNTTTIEIITTCSNSFTRNKRNVLRFILSPNT
ncbi:MAG: prepilin-type N-terminal cleavage/methylation domain-containing protein [Pseudomonadota bacterium]